MSARLESDATVPVHLSFRNAEIPEEPSVLLLSLTIRCRKVHLFAEKSVNGEQRSPNHPQRQRLFHSKLRKSAITEHIRRTFEHMLISVEFVHTAN